MSSAFETSLGNLRDQALTFSAESINEMTDMTVESVAKIRAGTYGADDAAADVARGASKAARDVARAANLFIQAVAAMGTLDFDGESDESDND